MPETEPQSAALDKAKQPRLTPNYVRALLENFDAGVNISRTTAGCLIRDHLDVLTRLEHAEAENAALRGERERLGNDLRALWKGYITTGKFVARTKAALNPQPEDEPAPDHAAGEGG